MIEDVEEWRDVPEYEGYYQVSNLGRVRSLDRWVTYSNGRKRFYRGREIAGRVNEGGYRDTTLRMGNIGRVYRFSQLVAMAFLDHKPNGHKLVVDHIDGKRLNDRLTNLRIVTNRANCTICYRSNKSSLSSQYSGVRYRDASRRWHARITFEGEEVNLGTYDDEKDASSAYQSAVTLIEDGIFNPDDYKPEWSSKYKGVNFHKRIGRWQSRATIDGKRKNLGYFSTELEAYHAIVQAEKQKQVITP